jgi:hypothetical protein
MNVVIRTIFLHHRLVLNFCKTNLVSTEFLVFLVQNETLIVHDSSQ